MTYFRFVLVYSHERYCRTLEGGFFEFVRCASTEKGRIYSAQKSG